ncbi:FKBP-type peptidyl-prolyl cis-trans isomerase [bacterium SCSIO 12741]|nr:FKBP-type peptidyl-prolyl cis-trans isomerase [bacterium SCSIO 12741]
MKKTLLLLSLCVITMVGFAAKKGKKGKGENKQTMEMKTEIDSLSYSLGISIANNLKSQGIDSLNPDFFAAALKDVMAGNDTTISFDDANKIINEYFGKAMQRKAEEAKAEGAAFLAENGKKEGVVTLPSGMQYRIITEGTGPKPTAQNKVRTHYHGTLIDGTVFDSSVNRGTPAEFPVGGVIKGWQEALQLMPVGSKWELFIPYDLAYGERGAGQNIGPYTTLIFEVELLQIVE